MKLKDIIVLGLTELALIGYSSYEVYRYSDIPEKDPVHIDSIEYIAKDLGISHQEAALLVKYDDITIPKYDINNISNNLKDIVRIKTYDIIRDDGIAEKFFWKELDSMPEELREYIIGKQLAKYAFAFAPEYWEKPTPDEWIRKPSLIKGIVAIKMVDSWNKELGLNKLIDDATGILCAIGLKESLFFNEAVFKDDWGLWQHSPYARKIISRNLGINVDEKDFLNPKISSMSASYWMKQMIAESGKDTDKAIIAYNMGIINASKNTKRGLEYLNDVKSRYNKYFVQNVSPTWDYMYYYALK